MINDWGPSWTPDAPPSLQSFLEIAPLPAPVLPVIAGTLALAYGLGLAWRGIGQLHFHAFAMNGVAYMQVRESEDRTPVHMHSAHAFGDVEP